MADAPLAIYLNDHLALVTAEIELCARMADQYESTGLGEYLKRHGEEASRQKDRLEQILSRISSRKNSLKEAAGWVAEKFGRLKPNNADNRQKELTRVVELEALLSATAERLTLWRMLAGAEVQLPASAGALVVQEELTESERQLFSLRLHHYQAARAAFA